MGEGREAYRLRILIDGRTVRTVELAGCGYVYPLALRQADGVTGRFEVRVAQASDQWGPGPEAGVIWNG